MSENFGLKIGLEGEKEFKKSLAEINNSFKILGSEMKLVDSQFDKNDKSTEALTARSEVLNKEIDQQKQKIETLRSALANAAESFGENDRRTQSWQIQLNNAKAALNGMERELNSNNTALEKADKGFDEAGDEAKDFSDSVKKAADTSEDADGKLSKLGDTAKKIGAALGAAAAAVGTACVAAGQKLWDMANDVGSAGDQIDKTSQKIGISAESYQKWGYVFERCGADVNNLQTRMKKLSTVITDAAGGSDSAAEKLSAVGLSIEELNGKSQDEQLSMVITALQGMEAGAERTAAANDLLGKSAVDMAAVLNTSVEETERLKQEAEDYGMVMSNEAVAASAAFEDSLTRLSHTAGGLKNRMVGELLLGITQITDGLADLLAGNEQAADELKNGVTSVIDTIRMLIPQFAELITSIAGAVLESAPGIIKALADGLLSAISELTPTLAKIVTEIISALVGLLPQIVSAGADILLSLIKGSPEERRRFLDMALSQLAPRYVRCMNEYLKVLSQKNNYLKKAASGVPDNDYLDVLSAQLASSGAVLIRQRYAFAERLKHFAGSFYASLTDSRETLDIRYLSAAGRDLSESTDIAQIRERLNAIYRADRASELRLCRTLHGPHKDDLAVYIADHASEEELAHTEGIETNEAESDMPYNQKAEKKALSVADFNARTFASQGQQRSAVLA